MSEKKKLYTYCYNRHTKEWEKISLENDLCNIKDSCKKERIAIIKDVLEFNRLYSDKDERGNKIEYLPIRLQPNGLLLVVGSGLSVMLLNSLTQEEMNKKINTIALNVRIDNGVAFGYLNVKDQVERYGLHRRDIVVLTGGEQQKSDKSWYKSFKKQIVEIIKSEGFEVIFHSGQMMLFLKRPDMYPDWMSKGIDYIISVKDLLSRICKDAEDIKIELRDYKKIYKKELDKEIKDEQMDVVKKLENVCSKLRKFIKEIDKK